MNLSLSSLSRAVSNLEPHTQTPLVNRSEAGLPQVVKQYRADAPKVELVLNTHPGSMRLEHDQYDVAVYPQDLILNSDAVCRRVMNSPVVLVANELCLDQTRFDTYRCDLSGHTSCRAMAILTRTGYCIARAVRERSDWRDFAKLRRLRTRSLN
jgi:DNA-binding transcriptional LysR family regulator